MEHDETRRSHSGLPLDGLGEVLRFLRKERGLTQDELAERSAAADETGKGVSAATIAKLETGTRGPSSTTLEVLSAALDVRPDAVRRTAITWQEMRERGASGLLLLDVLASALSGGPSTDEYGTVASTTGQPAPSGARGRGTAAAGTQRLSDVFERLRITAGALPREDADRLARQLDALAAAAALGVSGSVLSAVPPGTRWLLAPADVGVDAAGRLWVDPAAPVTDAGDADRNIVVERWDDGTYHVDVPDGVVPAEREPERHTYRAQPANQNDPDPTELAALYERTVVTIETEDGELRLDTGEDLPSLPDGWRTVHVITAWNPRSRLLLPGQNRERNRMLERDLRTLGLEPLPARGASPDGSWVEESFAVVNASEDVILELARRFEQNAVFGWNRNRLWVLWSLDLSK